MRCHGKGRIWFWPVGEAQYYWFSHDLQLLPAVQLRGVESHGEQDGEAELDVGCEFDTINYDFVVKHKGNK
jgi:hypothetical protein